MVIKTLYFFYFLNTLFIYSANIQKNEKSGAKNSKNLLSDPKKWGCTAKNDN